MRLSHQAEHAARTAEALAQRDAALCDLAELLDPAGTLSTWALAGRISGALRHFQARAYPRIAQGGRAPRGALEAALLACSGCCPTSQTKLHPLLSELRLGL